MNVASDTKERLFFLLRVEQPEILANALQVAYEHQSFVQRFAANLRRSVLELLQ